MAAMGSREIELSPCGAAEMFGAVVPRGLAGQRESSTREFIDPSADLPRADIVFYSVMNSPLNLPGLEQGMYSGHVLKDLSSAGCRDTRHISHDLCVENRQFYLCSDGT